MLFSTFYDCFFSPKQIALSAILSFSRPADVQPARAHCQANRQRHLPPCYGIVCEQSEVEEKSRRIGV